MKEILEGNETWVDRKQCRTPSIQFSISVTRWTFIVCRNLDLEWRLQILRIFLSFPFLFPFSSFLPLQLYCTVLHWSALYRTVLLLEFNISPVHYIQFNFLSSFLHSFFSIFLFAFFLEPSPILSTVSFLFIFPSSS